MENVDIEKAAVRDVGKYIDGPLLRSFISENDRTPIWDGDIFIYHGSKKDNEHFYGRVPLQVKGTEVTEFSDKEISYSKLTRRDLENFIKDGGCIFFVAELMMNDETQETVSRVFYCELSVAVITNLLNKKKDVQHPTFHLSPVPKKSDFPKIVADFSDARYKNLVVRDIDEIEGLEKRIDELLNITNCINKDEYKSFFSTHIANLEAMKREKESVWSEIKENYANLNSKTPNVVDESIRAEINLHSNYLLSNLYNCLSKWLDKFLVWIPDIIEIASNKMNDDNLYYLIYNYAKYLLSQNKYHLIGNYFDRALEIAKETSSSDSQWRVAETLFSMAKLHEKLKLYEKAKDEYTEVLKTVLTKYAEIEKMGVALDCINKLTFLYDKLCYPKETIALFKGLLRSLRLAANDTSSFYNWFLLGTLIRMGIFYKEQFQYDEMKIVLNDAQTVYNRLAMNQIDLESESEIVAIKRIILGSYHQALGCPNNAEAEYKIALDIYKKLAKANRDAYIDIEVTIHKILADLYSEERTEEAENEYNEVLKIYEELVEVNPDAYIVDLALLHKSFAILYLKNNRTKDAEKEFNTALDILKKEYEKEENYAYMGAVADILYFLGVLHYNSDNYHDAEDELKQAVEINKIFAKVNPNKYNFRVYSTLLQLSVLYKKDGSRIKEAKQACEEALSIIKSLAEDSPEKWTDFVKTAEQMLNTINEKLRTV